MKRKKKTAQHVVVAVFCTYFPLILFTPSES